MTAWWSGRAGSFLELSETRLLETLAERAVRRFRINEVQQLRAWEIQLPLLKDTLRRLDDVASWHVLLEFEIPRLGGRIDVVLLSPRAVFVIEFKVGADRFDVADQLQLEGYALDLQDFHAGSRSQPILPILVATEAATPFPTLPFLIGGCAPLMLANGKSLPDLVGSLDRLVPAVGHALDAAAWELAAYRPVPNVIEAACLLYDRNNVAEIASARADAFNLTRTADRIAAILARARADNAKAILFVTGIPGAGKTLCGLNVAFSRTEGEADAVFLTGNPTLVHVLREALVRDAVAKSEKRAPAAHRMKGVIQALPKFRDDNVKSGKTPPERVVVIDEAQRSWTEAHAIAHTRDRPVQLDRSEPAHVLDIMARHEGFAGIVCLIGNGQEIHDGEGGLAEWGLALVPRPEWRVFVSEFSLVHPEPRNRLAALDGLHVEPALHLTVPVRSLRHDATPAWVDAVLRGDVAAARQVIAQDGPVPFRLTRDLDMLRCGLRASARGVHRAGLVASAGARRLRAEGLGCELPHMDPQAVARWFLESWLRDRDVRASDSLEIVATQFSVQGLELDQVGVCWDADLIRAVGGAAESGPWQARSFRGTRWQIARDADKIAWRLNTYRVLLTRARYDTIIWVPRGDPDDPSRDPDIFDRIATFLVGCGVRSLLEPSAPRGVEPAPQLTLLMP
ncbi:DNA/RNA helicase domain-containing protein [Lichenicola sp.]|uniref:DNA/RNA helicase domain-containing protein n=1 Tax=Lichenicola sp. TaxID=2804529 RepID=UPI003B00675B